MVLQRRWSPKVRLSIKGSPSWRADHVFLDYSMGQQQHYSGSRQQQQHQPQTSSAYPPTYASSPALRGHSSRTADQAVVPQYQSTQVPRSPYQQPLGSMRASPGPIGYPASSNDTSSILSSPPHSYSYPTLQSTIPGQNMAPLGSNSSSYPPYVVVYPVLAVFLPTDRTQTNWVSPYKLRHNLQLCTHNIIPLFDNTHVFI